MGNLSFGKGGGPCPFIKINFKIFDFSPLPHDLKGRFQIRKRGKKKTLGAKRKTGFYGKTIFCAGWQKNFFIIFFIRFGKMILTGGKKTSKNGKKNDFFFLPVFFPIFLNFGWCFQSYFGKGKKPGYFSPLFIKFTPGKGSKNFFGFCLNFLKRRGVLFFFSKFFKNPGEKNQPL